jgi:hypothetical protein
VRGLGSPILMGAIRFYLLSGWHEEPGREANWSEGACPEGAAGLGTSGQTDGATAITLPLGWITEVGEGNEIGGVSGRSEWYTLFSGRGKGHKTARPTTSGGLGLNSSWVKSVGRRQLPRPAMMTKMEWMTRYSDKWEIIFFVEMVCVFDWFFFVWVEPCKHFFF